MRVVNQEFADSFIAELRGTEAEARAAWLAGIAKGKLGVGRSLGHDDRPTLDTTVSGVTPLAVVPEKTSVPGLLDVRHHVEVKPDAGRAGLLIDVSKAHKRARLSRRDHLHYYLSCHDCVSCFRLLVEKGGCTHYGHRPPNTLGERHTGHVHVDGRL